MRRDAGRELRVPAGLAQIGIVLSGPVGRPAATPVSPACPGRREIPFESLSVAQFYPRPTASANHQTAREAFALGSLRLYAESHGSVESKEYSGTRSAEKAIREAFGLLHRVNVATLKVFDKLRLQNFRVGHLADECGNGFLPGQQRGTVAPRSEDDLQMLFLRSGKNSLIDAGFANGVREFFQVVLVKMLARVRGRFHKQGKLAKTPQKPHSLSTRNRPHPRI